MKVTTSKHTTSVGQPTHSPREKRFDKAWKKVIRQLKENNHFRDEVQAFAQDTRARLQRNEQAYMDAMHGLCLHLITFFSRKSLE